MAVLAAKAPRRAHELAPARHCHLVDIEDSSIARAVGFFHLAEEAHIVAAHRTRLGGAYALAFEQEARPPLVHLRLDRRAVEVDDTRDELHFLALELRRILGKARALDELGMMLRLAVDRAPPAAANARDKKDQQGEKERGAEPPPFLCHQNSNAPVKSRAKSMP